MELKKKVNFFSSNFIPCEDTFSRLAPKKGAVLAHADEHSTFHIGCGLRSLFSDKS